MSTTSARAVNLQGSGKSSGGSAMLIEEKGGKAEQPSKPATQPTASGKHGEHHFNVSENLIGSLWTLKSSKPWKAVCDDLPRIVEEQRFSVLGKHDLRDTLSKTGSHYLDDEAMIFELCNPNSAAAVLSHRLDLAAVLPCRMAVCRKSGEPGSAIHLFLPTTLLENCFDTKMEEVDKKELSDLAQNTTNILKEIAKKAATK